MFDSLLHTAWIIRNIIIAIIVIGIILAIVFVVWATIEDVKKSKEEQQRQNRQNEIWEKRYAHCYLEQMVALHGFMHDIWIWRDVNQEDNYMAFFDNNALDYYEEHRRNYLVASLAVRDLLGIDVNEIKNPYAEQGYISAVLRANNWDHANDYEIRRCYKRYYSKKL